jgi:hypothetical protein
MKRITSHDGSRLMGNGLGESTRWRRKRRLLQHPFSMAIVFLNVDQKGWSIKTATQKIKEVEIDSFIIYSVCHTFVLILNCNTCLF